MRVHTAIRINQALYASKSLRHRSTEINRRDVLSFIEDQRPPLRKYSMDPEVADIRMLPNLQTCRSKFVHDPGSVRRITRYAASPRIAIAQQIAQHIRVNRQLDVSALQWFSCRDAVIMLCFNKDGVFQVFSASRRSSNRVF